MIGAPFSFCSHGTLAYAVAAPRAQCGDYLQTAWATPCLSFPFTLAPAPGASGPCRLAVSPAPPFERLVPVGGLAPVGTPVCRVAAGVLVPAPARRSMPRASRALAAARPRRMPLRLLGLVACPCGCLASSCCLMPVSMRSASSSRRRRYSLSMHGTVCMVPSASLRCVRGLHGAVCVAAFAIVIEPRRVGPSSSRRRRAVAGAVRAVTGAVCAVVAPSYVRTRSDGASTYGRPVFLSCLAAPAPPCSAHAPTDSPAPM